MIGIGAIVVALNGALAVGMVSGRLVRPNPAPGVAAVPTSRPVWLSSAEPTDAARAPESTRVATPTDPVASSPPARPSPSSRPSENTQTLPSGRAGPLDARAQRALIRSFLARMADPAVSYHLECAASISAGPESVELALTGDVSDGDVSLTMSVEVDGADARIEMIVKDGVAYARMPGGAWEMAERGSLGATSLSPFGAEDEAWLFDYVKPVQRRGQTLHLLRFGGAEWQPILGRFLRQYAPEMTVRRLVYDVYVTSDGAPRSASLVVDGRVRAGGRKVAMHVDMTLSYSRFGRPVTIQAPVRGSQPHA